MIYLDEKYITSILAFEHSRMIIWRMTRKSSTFFLFKFLELPSNITWQSFEKLVAGEVSSSGGYEYEFMIYSIKKTKISKSSNLKVSISLSFG